jgi:signal transduction histidine kinase
MSTAVGVVGWLETLAFCGLAVITLVDWVRHPGRQRAYLAWAIGLLAVVTLVGRFAGPSGQEPRWMTILTVPAFLGSGYALLLFRHSFIPLSRRTLVVLAIVVAAVSVALMALPVPQDPKNPPPLYLAAALGFIGLWCGFIIEPVVRFWMASRRRPAVQRARLRALSLGYGGIVAVIVVAIGVALGAGFRSSQNQVYQLTLGLIVLGIIPLLYLSFAPPVWVRRFWRAREESALRKATSELLSAASPTQLASDALGWALRLTGAERGLVAGPEGTVLAATGLKPVWERHLSTLDPGEGARLEALPDGGAEHVAVVAPLHAGASRGLIAVIGGPFTPVFGADEADRLGDYGVDVGVALERLDLERQLGRRAFELERSNEALQEFAYVASHDLQEPLRMVASYLQLIRSRYGSRLDADADEFIDFAVDGARRMQALIDDLLAYSRVNTKAAAMQQTQLTNVVDRAQANLRAAIEESGARIIVGRLPAVRGDVVQLVQLFQNLIANAIKFRGPETPEIRVDATRGDGEWVLTVRDNGIGIEPRHAERIFLIFKRLHPPDVYPGTGIGLSICRKIVERHGGHIWVESHLDGGAAFHFTFPDRLPLDLDGPPDRDDGPVAAEDAAVVGTAPAAAVAAHAVLT